MMKKITKTFLTLCAVFTLFTGSSLLASAAVKAPDSTTHTHYFTIPVHVDTEHEDLGTHQYVWGYDNNGNPIYHYDCRITNIIYVRDYKCQYCDALLGAREKSVVFTKHSVDHE